MKSKRRYDMTSRAAKAAATKKRICDSAIALYCNRPIEDFTLEEVAARADTTVQTVLRDFGSKDELVYAALDEMARGGVFLKPTPPGDVKAAVDAFFGIYEVDRRHGDAAPQRRAAPAGVEADPGGRP